MLKNDPRIKKSTNVQEGLTTNEERRAYLPETAIIFQWGIKHIQIFKG